METSSLILLNKSRVSNILKILHDLWGIFFLLAEEMGFEPMRDLRLLAVFETAPFNHLGIPPKVV